MQHCGNRGLLAQSNEFLNRHPERMSKLISKLIAIESAAHVHENCRDFVEFLGVATANLERPVKGKESKNVTLVAESIFDVNADTRHESVECPSFRSKLAPEHRLNKV